jgi:hypothetical protein
MSLNDDLPTTRVSGLSLPIIFVALVATGVGCARTAGDGADHPEQASLATEDARDGGVAPAPLDGGAAPGPHVIGVRANGTGCPNDKTWESKVSPDGTSAMVELRAYDVSVSRGEAFAIEDCVLSVQIGDSAGYAYTLESFESSGYASVRSAGVRGEESVKYYFQGNPVASESRTKEFASGTTGAPYTFSNQFAGESAVWSPCGGGRDLNVLSRVVLRNNPEKTGQGYISPQSVKLQLHWRQCKS